MVKIVHTRTLFVIYNKLCIFCSNNKRKGVLFFILWFFGDSIFCCFYVLNKISICFFCTTDCWTLCSKTFTPVQHRCQYKHKKYTVDEQPSYKRYLVEKYTSRQYFNTQKCLFLHSRRSNNSNHHHHCHHPTATTTTTTTSIIINHHRHHHHRFGRHGSA